jgi:hypothetical protein
VTQSLIDYLVGQLLSAAKGRIKKMFRDRVRKTQFNGYVLSHYTGVRLQATGFVPLNNLSPPGVVSRVEAMEGAPMLVKHKYEYRPQQNMIIFKGIDFTPLRKTNSGFRAI